MSNKRDNYLECARLAREVSGVGILTQLREILSLRSSKSQLGASEYYFYRLFDRRLTAEARHEFAGYRRERDIDRLLNEDNWRALANDKLVMYAAIDGLGLPYPRIKAVCHVQGRRFPRSVPLTSGPEIRDFLSAAEYPIFMKPVHGSYGRGACSAMAFDALADSIVLGNGEPWGLDEAVPTFLESRSHGYLFQEMVKPHESIRAFCRATASSVRVVTVWGACGPEIFRCAWKIPVGRNMSDNFIHGKVGNLLALVDSDSGSVVRVITGPGFSMKEVDVHPDTGQRLLGFQLPSWQALRELCLQAASAFPGLKLQNWDIAIGESGPVILEVNVEGSMDLHQLAGARGIQNGILAELLAVVESGR